MQLILLGLVLGILMHDAALPPPQPMPDTALPLLAALVFGPKLLLGAAYFGLCAVTLRRLGKRGAQRAVQRHERIGGAVRFAALGLFVLDLYAGALVALRAHVGDFILLDELALMLPTVALLVWFWWAYYPIERRIREAALIGQLDQGKPIYHLWTRGQYLLAQLRHHVALVLVPAILLIGWLETVGRYAPNHSALLGANPQPLLVAAGALGIFLLAPLIIRYLWDTVPLPAGETRDRLLAMCRKHRVGVRELLLWRTFGGVINAAVMGLIAPLRYILLSDALLEQIRKEQVEAVMAHELAHVRRHHMFWLLITAVGALGVLELVFAAVLAGAQTALPAPSPRGPQLVQAGYSAALTDWLHSPEALVIGTLLAAGACWLAVFGWVSRRIERQADTFAAQHLATQRDAPDRDAHGRTLIDAESAHTMVAALQQVAELNHIPTAKRSWRHGSIAWRQGHLRSLVGRPVDDTPIDRQMRWIKIAGLAAVALLVIAHTLLSQQDVSFFIM